jgi:hypothetical protein
LISGISMLGTLINISVEATTETEMTKARVSSRNFTVALLKSDKRVW